MQRRLEAPEYKHKNARLTFKASKETIAVAIKDEGNGFDWSKYVELSPGRATDPHGRGIATPRLMSFDSLEHVGGGNEVACTGSRKRGASSIIRRLVFILSQRGAMLAPMIGGWGSASDCINAGACRRGGGVRSWPFRECACAVRAGFCRRG
jgi:hypothetical protein